MFPRRREDPFKQLLRGRSHAFVALPDGLHALVSVTRLVVIVRVFSGGYDGDPLHTWHFARRDCPEALHDGQGFNLAVLGEFLRSLGESCADDKESSVKSKRMLAVYARMALETRRKQRSGSSCLMIPCKAIRQFIPALKAETVKFWLLGAANGDELGRAWGKTDYFWRFGYHPEKTDKRLTELEDLGLIRYIRRAQRDPATGRYLQDVYQFNPQLFYIRKALRGMAMGIVGTPFGELPTVENRIGLPDRKVRGKSDHNQSLDPDPVIQSQRTKTSEPKQVNHHHHQTTESGDRARWNEESDNLPKDPAALPAQSAKTKSQKPKTTTPAAQAATQTPAPQGAQTEPPPNSARPPSRRADFEQPLADDGAEFVAQRIKARCETRLWQARELVNQYGAALSDRALEMVVEEKKKRFVKTEIGLMRYWLDKGMVKVEEQAHYDPYEFAGFAGMAGD